LKLWARAVLRTALALSGRLVQREQGHNFPRNVTWGANLRAAARLDVSAQSTDWQRIGNQIDAAFVFALAHFVSLDAYKQPDVPQKA